MMKMPKSVYKAALLSLVLLGSNAWSDDTELFFGSGASANVAPPLLMFSLDWRPNLTSTFCSDVTSASCRDSMGQEIYDAMELGAQDGSDLYTTAGSVALFDTFRAVFKLIFESTLMDDMAVGLMMNHDNACSGNQTTGCSNGGYILRGFELFSAGDANGAKAELLNIMANIPAAQGNESHAYQGKELFFEFYRYLTGQKVLRGTEGWDDYSSQNPGGTPGNNLDHEFGNISGGQTCSFGSSGETRDCENYIAAGGTDSNLNKNGDRISSALTWDPTIMNNSETRYIDPYDNSLDWSCSKTFTINMMFQVSQQEDSLDTELGAAITSGSGEGGLDLTTNTVTFPGVISKLHNMDHASAAVGDNIDGTQNVTSYFFVDQVNTTTNGYASAGGTGLAIGALSDPESLLIELEAALGQINSDSTSFVSVTVPVNAENRTSALDNLYLALFRVDPAGAPLWAGNVKRVEISEDATGEIIVKDALGASAFNPLTGKLNDTALTVWTRPDAEDVVAADALLSEVSGRDGSTVTRGGAGQKIPGFKVVSPATQGDVGEKNSDNLRQVYLEAASFSATDPTGNAVIALDADNSSSLLADTAIQILLTVLNADSSLNDTFVEEVLTNAGIAYSSPLSAATAAQQTSAASDATQVLLKWVRGIDVFDWDADGVYTDVRPWLWGDILHSRPLSINYGPLPPHGSDNQDVRLIFGTNDGLIHFVRNTDGVSAAPALSTQTSNPYGEELWALMPRQLLSIVPDLLGRSNVGADGHPYGVDGEPVLFAIDNDDDGIIERTTGNDVSCAPGSANCDKAYVYFGLRRGGNSYFALDVSDPDDLPRLLWRADDTGDFSELAMSFSTPRVGWVQFERVTGLNVFGTEVVPTPVVIFGGGYYGGWDASHVSRIGKDDLSNTADDPKGNAIFIVHARTGQLIWKATTGASTGGFSNQQFIHADMDHSISAPVTPMDSNGNRIIDRLYVGDSHGQVWRVDLPEYDDSVADATYRSLFRKNNWEVTRLADFSGTGVTDLRFFHSAGVVQSSDTVSSYDGIALGSGDRAHPQSEITRQNWFFMIKDRAVVSGSPGAVEFQISNSAGAGYLKDITSSCLNQTDAACSDTNLATGWRLELGETGEKNLSPPLISADIITFTTYLPEGSVDDASCVVLGRSRIYQTKLNDGSPLSYLHPDAVEGSYTDTDRWIDGFEGIDGGIVAISPDTGINSSGTTVTIGAQRPTQFYWRERGVDTIKTP